jgi:hypothetical protein
MAAAAQHDHVRGGRRILGGVAPVLVRFGEFVDLSFDPRAVRHALRLEPEVEVLSRRCARLPGSVRRLADLGGDVVSKPQRLVRLPESAEASRLARVLVERALRGGFVGQTPAPQLPVADEEKRGRQEGDGEHRADPSRQGAGPLDEQEGVGAGVRPPEGFESSPPQADTGEQEEEGRRPPCDPARVRGMVAVLSPAAGQRCGRA